MLDRPPARSNSAPAAFFLVVDWRGETMKSKSYAFAWSVWLLLAPLVCAEDSALRLEVVDAATPNVHIKVHGLPADVLRAWRLDPPAAAELHQILAVFLKADESAATMLGSYAVDDDCLIFRPRFPLRAGRTYRAELRPRQIAGVDSEELPPQIAVDFVSQAQAGDAAATRLVEVFPTAGVLPENQLKFYLHFSGPMSRGESYRHLELWDDNDQRIEFPFLELPEELWDPLNRRFTLFLDPGRIKRGLKPREEFGPALEEGRSYTLVVQAAWPDAHGRPLAGTFRKRFRVVAPDDQQPAVSRWRIDAPPADSRDPLRVHFDEPLDHGLAQRVIAVEDQAGRKVAGSVAIADSERTWRFVPQQAWRAGSYALVVDTCLEDLAGNSLARPFEVDLFEKVDRELIQELVRIPWQIAP
jgi:hypothetical protein